MYIMFAEAYQWTPEQIDAMDEEMVRCFTSFLEAKGIANKEPPKPPKKR